MISLSGILSCFTLTILQLLKCSVGRTLLVDTSLSLQFLKFITCSTSCKRPNTMTVCCLQLGTMVKSLTTTLRFQSYLYHYHSFPCTMAFSVVPWPLRGDTSLRSLSMVFLRSQSSCFTTPRKLAIQNGRGPSCTPFYVLLDHYAV